MKSILYVLLLTIPLVLTPAQASAPSLTVTMDAASYSASGIALSGDAPVATVRLVDAEGNATAGAEVRLVILRQVQFIGFVSNETIVGTTDADGVFTTPVGTASTLPGNYLVVARVGTLVAQTRYTVGA